MLMFASNFITGIYGDVDIDVEKHEIYAAAFSRNHFYDLLLQDWGGPLSPPPRIRY